MTSQSRYADEIINSSDAIQECIEVLPEVASLWVLYQFAETFETFDEEEPVPFTGLTLFTCGPSKSPRGSGI